MMNTIETLTIAIHNHYGKMLLGLAGYGVYATLTVFAETAKLAAQN